MDMKKLSLWNWFKKEDENEVSALPATGYPSTFLKMQQDMDRLFNAFFQGGYPDAGQTLTSQWLKPQADIVEKEKEYQIHLEIPGVEEKDVTIALTGDTLTIKGEKKFEKEDKTASYHRLERSYGSFQRVITLPSDADVNHIDATFKNGVLGIRVGKDQESSYRARKIELKKGA